MQVDPSTPHYYGNHGVFYGTPYKVFTPFYRRGCLAYGDTPRTSLPNPDIYNNIRSLEENGDI